MLSTIDFELDTYLALFTGIFLVTDMNIHTWKMFFVNEFEFNTNTHMSENRREFEMYLFPRAWYCHGLSQEKQGFGRILFSTRTPSPPQKCTFHFDCRLAVSDLSWDLRRPGLWDSYFWKACSFGVVHGQFLPFSVVVHLPKFGSRCEETCENYKKSKVTF